jgi:hypothetical protein
MVKICLEKGVRTMPRTAKAKPKKRMKDISITSRAAKKDHAARVKGGWKSSNQTLTINGVP